MTIARILCIGGSDSGGGAGIQADLKTVTMLGGHGMTAITSVTAQNSEGVTGIHGIPAEMVLEQIDACITDFGVDAIKVGMIGSALTARLVAERLEQLNVPIVVDPVMVATSGATLSDDKTIKAMEDLLKLATLATPNTPELQRLSGKTDSIEGALSLVAAHGCAVLVKGGHEEGETVGDALIEADNMTSWQGTRIMTRHSHGTGCTLASAIATFLGGGASLSEAVDRAREFVRIALYEAPGIGRGSGPMGHGRVRLDVGMGIDAGPRLNQITITGSDYAKMVDFYSKLGLKQIVDSPDNQYARFETSGGGSFSVQCDPEAPREENFAVYFECDDLDRRCERLARKGLPFEHAPRNQPWGWREARLRDPHGNTVFLYKAGEMRRYPEWRIKPGERG